jgi:hypothetical protein
MVAETLHAWEKMLLHDVTVGAREFGVAAV